MDLALEPLARAHLPDMAALLDDPDVLRFTRVPEPPPAGFERAWLARYEAGRADGTSEAFAAVDAGGRFVALALAPRIDAPAREVELGYLVAPGLRGRGAATAVLRLLTEWAFGGLGALRAYLIIDVDNHASQKVAERCGYVLEGVLRSTHLKQDRRVDVQLWSRLPGDP